MQVHLSQVLGTGSYGSGVRATLDRLPCAAKILHPIFRSDNPGAIDPTAHFVMEYSLLKELMHPCIMQFVGVVLDYNCRPILLMELMDESLTNFLQCSSNPLPYYNQVNITHDITLALAFLHIKGVIHRDLSSNNVLINAGIKAKVTDFGMSKMLGDNSHMTHSQVTQCSGTPVFMPPEALGVRPCYSEKLDTFSAGVLMVQIITHKFPAPNDAEIVMDDPTAPTGEKIVPVPELECRRSDINQVPPTYPLLPIIFNCLKDRDKDRPSADQLCQILTELKTSIMYDASKRDNQLQIASLS